MLSELGPTQRASLRPLFENFPGLHGCLHAVLEGAMGRAWADDPANPRVALAELDFRFLAGDARSPASELTIRGLEPPWWSLAASDDAWGPALRRVWGERLGTRERVAFASPREWDRERLRGFVESVPDCFALKRIERVDAERFGELADSLVYNFESLDDFIARGVGFGIEHEGRYVSGCASFAISSHSLEFDIQTHQDYLGRDLATATASAMILHCLNADLEPCWDAQNDISAKLATKLGFVAPTQYTAYEVHD